MDADAAAAPGTSGPGHAAPPQTAPGQTLDVRCPDCRRTFRASRAAADHEELTCPCGNKGFVAPGNARQMTDRQVEQLTDEQFALYMRHGFEVVDLAAEARLRPWGKGPRVWSRLALGSLVLLLGALVVGAMVGRHDADDEAGGELLAWGLLLAGLAASLFFSHVALRKRSGGPFVTWTVLVVAWAGVLVAGLAFAGGHGPGSGCDDAVVGATWNEPAAGDALRALGVARPVGDMGLPAPGDRVPYLSSLLEVELVTWNVYYGASFNATAADVTVRADKGIPASEVRPGLVDFLVRLTGNPEEAGPLADEILAYNASDGFQIVVLGGAVEDAGLRAYGTVQGPFRLAELRNETQGNASWKFSWQWAQWSPAPGTDGEFPGRLHVGGNGLVSAQTSGLDKAEIQAAATRTFAANGLPAPTFTGFHAAQRSACVPW